MSDRRIVITAGDVTVDATLDDSQMADLVWEALPITASASTWGDEIYFGIPVSTDEHSTAQETVDMGAVGYWPPGNAMCLFFGRTPASRGDEIRPASAVNVFGMIEGDPTRLKAVRSGERIEIRRAG